MPKEDKMELELEKVSAEELTDEEIDELIQEEEEIDEDKISEE